jgi:hypothetical protein
MAFLSFDFQAMKSTGMQGTDIGDARLDTKPTNRAASTRCRQPPLPGWNHTRPCAVVNTMLQQLVLSTPCALVRQQAIETVFRVLWAACFGEVQCKSFIGKRGRHFFIRR